MPCERAKLLLIGYGNPGRLDDGLGPALADAVEKLGIPGVTVESNYHLTVEDAAQIAEHDVVIFADADVAGPEPFWFRPVKPRQALSFTSHSLEPQAALALAHQLFNKRTEGYILGIRGYRFNEFAEELSDRARANLDAAVAFVGTAIRDRCFSPVPGEVEEDALTTTGLSIEEEKCKTENM